MDTLLAIRCCDCGTPCVIRFALLTPTDQIVCMTTCEQCNDHKTLRFFDKIEHADWVNASKSVPMVSFARRAA